MGAFRIKTSPAKANPVTRKLEPATHELEFDPTTRYDDDALADFLAREREKEPRQVKEELNKYVEILKQELESGKRVQIDGIGYFYTLGKSDARFSFSRKQIETPHDYGLSREVFKPIREHETSSSKSKKSSKDTKADKQKNSKMFRLLLVTTLSAALITFIIATQFTGITPGLKIDFGSLNKNRFSHLFDNSEYAGIIDTLAYPDDDPVKEQVDSSIDAMTDMQNALSINMDEDPGKDSTIKPDTTPEKQMHYHIIAGSFATEQKAMAHQERLLKRGYEANIVHSDNRYRVSIREFTSKELALEELFKIRKLEGNENYWLLKQQI